MKRIQSRLILILVGFFLLIIPLIFFNNSLKKLLDFTKEKTKNSLRQKILSAANRVEENLNPYNYLKSEFIKIHSELLPDLPNNILEGIPEDSYINTIYDETLFNKLKKLTIEKYTPIIITFATNNFDKIYSYFTPKLENDLNKENEKEQLIKSKVFFDYELIEKYFKNSFDKFENYSPYIIKVKTERSHHVYERYCYKYITRFNSYNRNLNSMYTDYYQNQTLYPIFRYTISKKGIHGYYSLLIPQSCINPVSIINNILLNPIKDIDIKFIKSNNPSKIIETKEGIDCCYLNLTTDFINHLNSFQRLNKIYNKSKLLEYQFIITPIFPEDLIRLEYLTTISFYFSIFISLLYIFIAFTIIKSKRNIHLLITHKLIFILSIIIILPITGIGISSWMSFNNLKDLIDYNVSQSLNNELNNYNTINQEVNLRYLSFILEMKRKIAKGKFYPEMKSLSDNILTKKESETWFYYWVNSFFTFADNENTYFFSSSGNKDDDDFSRNRSREEKYYKLFFLKYLDNLGLQKKNITNKDKEIQNTLSLGLLEHYITPDIEELSIPKESIPQKDFINFNETSSAVYSFAKDKDKNNYLLFFRKYPTNTEPYKYIEKYTEKINPLWFIPSNEFADMNLGVILDNRSEEKPGQWPAPSHLSREMNTLLKETLTIRDSGSNKTKTPNETTIKQWITTENDPYIIAGIAKSKYETETTFIFSMIFPILLMYAILLLMILTGFISNFINKPISIYKKAIKELNNNQYGITIKSFSKDEFNNITKAFNEMSIAIKQKEQIKRYVSDKLIESMNSNKIQNAGEGKIEKVTILSSDIRNFTGISEQYEPSVIVEMLNTYFTKMQNVISENGGIIDKYIGDAIQAVFYEESDKENQVFRAAKAAISMRKALAEYNKERMESGLFTIENGIGIDSDEAITGTIGTTKGRKDFSVNGNVISRAANLEAKTKLTKSKILISRKSMEELNCHADKSARNDGLIFIDFDSESVELVDVRQ